MNEILVDATNNFSFDVIKSKGILVAGATGSGKSVFLHKVIKSLEKYSAKKVQLFLIDLKQTEFCKYQNNDNLLKPIAKDFNSAVLGLNYAIEEMENRYKIFKQKEVYNIEEYNKLYSNAQLPYIIIIVDEAAELLGDGTMGGYLLEKIASTGRGKGVHLILSTQMLCEDRLYPSLKANLQTRVCFRVSDEEDSLIVVHQKGAEDLKVGEFLYVDPQHGIKKVLLKPILL